MTERPIIFNDAMSLAVVEGRKTVTRRPIADMGGDEAYTFSRMAPGGVGALFTLRDGRYTTQRNHSFGVPGDKLWVREAWRVDFADTLIEYRADPGMNGAKWLDESCDIEAALRWSKKLAGGKWAPSIHMPRWASRTVLDVLDVRVERLQSMSEEDARAEGVAPHEYPYCDRNARHRMSYARLWDEIYPTMKWASNPWVWVIEFRRAA